LIAAEAMTRGLQFNIRHLDRGEPLPDSEEAEALVVMCGPLGVYESRSYPFLTRSAWRGHLPDGLLEGRDLKRHLIAQCGKEVFRNFF